MEIKYTYQVPDDRLIENAEFETFFGWKVKVAIDHNSVKFTKSNAQVAEDDRLVVFRKQDFADFTDLINRINRQINRGA